MKRKETRFKVVVDTREQAPLAVPAHWRVRGTLRTGDYSIEGYETSFAIERKSLEDLVHSLTHDRARFEREMRRLAGFQFKRVLVESPYSSMLVDAFKFSMARPYAIRASVAAFEVRYGIPFVFASGRKEALGHVMRWARYFVREQAKSSNSEANETAR